MNEEWLLLEAGGEVRRPWRSWWAVALPPEGLREASGLRRRGRPGDVGRGEAGRPLAVCSRFERAGTVALAMALLAEGLLSVVARGFLSQQCYSFMPFDILRCCFYLWLFLDFNGAFCILLDLALLIASLNCLISFGCCLAPL